MARTKRKINPILPAAAVSEPETASPFLVAGYIRLSIEDGGKPGADTIESQREMVLSYISQQPDMRLHSFYCDNGRTGTNFDRPEFERLMNDVRSGVVNCIVVKDGCVNIELNSEGPQKCGFCDVSSVFDPKQRRKRAQGGARRGGRPSIRQSRAS